MSRRGIQVLGLAVVGGAGYYLYSAGGDPKLAQKKAEADASKASAKIKSEVPGRAKEAQKNAESLAQQAASQFDKAKAEGKSALSDAEAKAKEFKDRTGKELNAAGKEMKAATDEFDRVVEKKTAEAKSGISSWFSSK